MKRTLSYLVVLLTLLTTFTAAAFAEQGVLNGDEYTFTDRAGNTVTVPVNSFASYVVDFQHGDPWMNDEAHTDPQIAVGLPDYVEVGSNSTGDLCMGSGGVLVLGFDTSIYDGQGDDVYVFEVGGYVEETKVEVSDDLDTWYEIGVAEGSTAGLDIAGKVPQGAGFRYVRLTDTGANPNGGWPGADIDAVCGLNTRALPDEPPSTYEPASTPGLAFFGEKPGADNGGGTVQPGRAFDDRLDLLGTWQGFYLGMSNDVGIVRRIRVGVTECADGFISGTLYFETPTAPEDTGEYRIGGTVDGQGNVHFQGNGEWVVFCEDFDQASFDGRLCECGDTVNGVVNNDANRAFFIERVENSSFETNGGDFDEEGNPNDYEGPGDEMPPGLIDGGDGGNQAGPGDDGIAGTIDDYPIMLGNFNVGAVQDGAPYAPDFVPEQDIAIVSITTYHWNSGQGSLPGSISLVDYGIDGTSEGTLVGEWEAIPREGYLGAPNVNWDAYCEVTLQAGHTYVVYDSDWQTWSFNDESDEEGFVELRGYPLGVSAG